MAMDKVFAMIFNIPQKYRACHLRNFFSEVLEPNGFVFFHYRHRPMNLMMRKRDDDSEAKETKGRDKSHSEACCCIVQCKLECYVRLATSYHLHHWKDEEDSSHPTQCFVHPIYCITDVGDKHDLAAEFTVKVSDDKAAGNLYMAYDDLMQLKELQPPDIMPQGNVGTSTETFLQLVNSCRLPPLVINKLNIKFKKKGGKFYSSVAYDYSGNETNGATPQPVTGPALTGHRHRILSHVEYVEERAVEQRLHRHMDRCKPHNKLLTDSTSGFASGSSAASAAYKHTQEVESDGEVEEWDRHETFYDDSANIERNKERLFEEKIELKWEKGGSGLVFYTDAQYWKQLEGDFDEQTTDDWDVDMSEYIEAGTGDKDARDYVKMRAEDRLRGDIAHLEEISSFDKPIGCFEQHTKGVGRSVLEKQGWIDGKGMGRSEEGRAHIIDTSGQHPRDKRGLGFHGEKVARFISPARRKRRSDEPIISTVYDDPTVTDEYDTLLQRTNPHNIKHRTLSKHKS